MIGRSALLSSFDKKGVIQSVEEEASAINPNNAFRRLPPSFLRNSVFAHGASLVRHKHALRMLFPHELYPLAAFLQSDPDNLRFGRAVQAVIGGEFAIRSSSCCASPAIYVILGREGAALEDRSRVFVGLRHASA